jgi:death on curing protein
LHEDLYAMAAAYAFHLAEAQAFLDGNKRVAAAAAIVFLDFNGIEILDPSGRLYDAMLAIAVQRLDKAGLAHLLRSLPRTPVADEPG